MVLLKQSKAQMSRLFANFVSFKQTEPETFSFFFFGADKPTIRIHELLCQSAKSHELLSLEK